MSRRSRRFRPLPTIAPSLPAKPSVFYKLLPFVLFVFAYINVGIGSVFYPLDYDLGWHLKYGADVVENHVISSTNTYSVELPGYYWRNNSWLSDVLRYLLFKFFSFQGLIIAGVVTMVGTFFIYSKTTKTTFWEAALIFPILTFMEIPLTSASFRAQLLSFTGIGIIMWILARYQAGHKKTLLWLIPLYVVWTNLHGGFFLGTIYLVAWTVFYVLQLLFLDKSLTRVEILKQHVLPLSGAIVAATAASFLNPWGTDLYLDHLSFFTAGNPSQFLVEWKPLYINTSLLKNHVLFGFIYAGSLAVIFWKGRHKQMLPLIVFVTILYVAAIFSRRFAWTMYLMAYPILADAFRVLKPKNLLVSAILCLVVSVGFFSYIWNQNVKTMDVFGFEWNRYCAYTGCSPPSAQFLINNRLTNKKMYTTYDWGGWLIWNYPLVKPLIDGRMSTWVDDTGYNAFLNYIGYENNWVDINESKYEVVYLSPGKRALFNRLMELVKENKWTVAYRDNYASVFVRNK